MEILKWVIVVTFAFLGGLTQTVTGFGAAIVMMLAFPYFFSLSQAPALASSIGLLVSGSLTVQFFQYIDFKKCLIPTLIYTILSFATVMLTKYVDIRTAGLIYGVFLLLLAFYYFFLSGKLKMKAGPVSMLFASTVSGVAGGFFGIGGPLMAVYYSDIFTDKLVYMASIQFNFFVGNVIAFITRISQGIYTADLIKYTLAGFVAIFLGRQTGLRIVNQVDRDLLKKLIYGTVAVSGVLTILKYL